MTTEKNRLRMTLVVQCAEFLSAHPHTRIIGDMFQEACCNDR